MALLSTQVSTVTGTAITYAAAAGGGDTFALLSGYQDVRVKNASGGSITVTLVIPGNTAEGQAVPDVPVAVAAGAEKSIKVPASAVDSTTGLCSLTYSGVTSLTVAVVSLG